MISPRFNSAAQIINYRAHHGGMFPAEPIILVAKRSIKANEEITFSYDGSDDQFNIVLQRAHSSL